ncbi:MULTISPECIES: hypothetical protein [unclassified Providencia]|uniref:hypothetical protein n=1 Tax=unclassified Providencia TaxID=2633465 RepID=UPI00234A53A9|nr:MULTISPECIES: hypothetical protein [unclassified Providencia]
MAKSSGTISIENKWNQDIKKVEIIYHCTEDEYDKVFVTYNIPDNHINKNTFNISYSYTGLSAWIGNVTTKDGKKWSSGSFLNCNANKAQNCQIVISFDGNKKEMTVCYPGFNICSKGMIQIASVSDEE